MGRGTLRPAGSAFDAIALGFDARFGEWKSVAAQRNAVRQVLESSFPRRSRIVEIGGGTGEDAVWLARRGREVLLTDVSPTMVGIARRKLRETGGSRARVAAAEEFDAFATELIDWGETPFDGAFSNFAALNCVDDLSPVARGLARLVRPYGQVVLVMFGPFCPGEVVVETWRGRWRSAFRRLRRGPVPARLGDREFGVTYHRPADLSRAMTPWFRELDRTGVGVFVPPSAAEPWISRQPRLLGLLESLDRAVSRRVPLLGDHVLYRFERTEKPVRQ